MHYPHGAQTLLRSWRRKSYNFVQPGSKMEPETPNEQVIELLLHSLEHENGGVQVYETALKCAVNEDLKEEWEKYLEEATHHVAVLNDVCQTLGIDAAKETPG